MLLLEWHSSNLIEPHFARHILPANAMDVVARTQHGRHDAVLVDGV